jgi:hypothetical protein
VIFETPCTDKKFEKNHATPYLTSVVPEILNTKISWIRYWNFIIMAFAAFYSFIGPFCFAFGVSSQLEQYICTIGDYFEYVNMVMFFLDVFVEILGACPVEGNNLIKSTLYIPHHTNELNICDTRSQSL